MGTSVVQDGERMRGEARSRPRCTSAPRGMPGEGVAEMIIDPGNEIMQKTEQMIRIRRRQEGQEHGAGAIRRLEITAHARAGQQTGTGLSRSSTERCKRTLSVATGGKTCALILSAPIKCEDWIQCCGLKNTPNGNLSKY